MASMWCLSVWNSRQLSIQETARDTKKDLENYLKSTCERFIAQCSEKLLAEFFMFTQKLQKEGFGATPNAPPAGGMVQLQAGNSGRFQNLMREYETVLESTKTQVKAYISLLKFYLPNPLTMNILFRPIKGHLMEAYQTLFMTLSNTVQNYNRTQRQNAPNPGIQPKELLQWAEQEERRANAASSRCVAVYRPKAGADGVLGRPLFWNLPHHLERFVWGWG